MRASGGGAGSQIRFLVIRRDNIGDLVCTTPLLRGLRTAHPGAWIGVVVNSYNAPVLEGNADVDEALPYRKAKHNPGESRLRLLLERARFALKLQTLRPDAVLVASPGARAERMAMGVRAGRILVRGERAGASGRVTVVAEGAGHEVERTFTLGEPFGVTGVPPPVKVHSATHAPCGMHPTLGVHISARKPSQRWPASSFAQLIRSLDPRWQVKLFWAPGTDDDPMHPGDDRKAAALAAELAGRAVPVPTRTLRALVDGLAGCHAMLCADGGAMHLAAGLGLPVTCLFGDSDAIRWRPWGVPSRLLQPASRCVNDISVDEARAALLDLLAGWPPQAT